MKEQVLLKLGLSTVEPHILAGAITIFVVFLIMLAVTRAIPWDAPGRRVKKAMKMGHVVPARRFGLYDDDNTGHAAIKMYFCTYRYQVDGVAYELGYCGKTYPPATASVYYIRDPEKGFLNIRSNKGLLLLFLTFGVPIIVGGIVVNLLK